MMLGETPDILNIWHLGCSEYPLYELLALFKDCLRRPFFTALSYMQYWLILIAFCCVDLVTCLVFFLLSVRLIRHHFGRVRQSWFSGNDLIWSAFSIHSAWIVGLLFTYFLPQHNVNKGPANIRPRLRWGSYQIKESSQASAPEW